MSDEFLNEAEAEKEQYTEELDVGDEVDAADEVETAEAEESADDDEVIVSIGEESPPSNEQEHKAPEWVRELRKNHKETVRKNKELEDRLAAISAAQEKPVEQLGAKPRLEDFDYDAESFETALDAWHERKKAADERIAKANAERESQQQAWQVKIDEYSKAKSMLKVKDFEDAEFVAQNTLSITQQGVILQGAENPALLVYALGKNPVKAKELAAINDPVKFAFAIAKMETQLKVTNKKTAPTPEKTVRGTAGVSGTVSNKLNELKAKAQASGDYTDYFAFKRSMKK